MTITVVKEFDDFIDEVTGIRLGAVSQSVWNIRATIGQRVREAFADAIAVYPVFIRHVEYTLPLGAGVSHVVLPPDVSRVHQVFVLDASLSVSKEIRGFQLVATPATNFLMFQESPSSSPRWVEAHYETRLKAMPPNLLAGIGQEEITAHQTTLLVNPDYWDALQEWPERGYFAVKMISTSQWNGSYTGQLHRFSYGWLYPYTYAPSEYIHYSRKQRGYYTGPYGTATFKNHEVDSGFTGLSHGMFGSRDRGWATHLEELHPQATSSTLEIVPIIIAEPELLSVLKEETTANMMEYWLIHRTQYTSYAASLAIQQLEPRDLMAMIRLFESRAERRYKASRDLPNSYQAQIKRRGD